MEIPGRNTPGIRLEYCRNTAGIPLVGPACGSRFWVVFLATCFWALFLGRALGFGLHWVFLRLAFGSGVGGCLLGLAFGWDFFWV